jgi:hypothetical protein
MKKIIMTSLLLLGMSSLTQAAGPKFKVPVSVNNVSDETLRAAGVEKCVLVTSTDAALATDSTGSTITDGYIYFVIIGSTDTLPAGSLFLEMRSTNTANLTSARLMPRIQAMETVTAKRMIPQIVNFDPPIPFSNGLSLNIGPAGANPSGGPQVTEFGVGLRWKQQ